MSAVSNALRKFIVNATRTFYGAKSLIATATIGKWKAAVFALGRRARSLAAKFSALRTTKRVASNGEELVMLGRIDGRSFTNLLRTARSVEAYEAAAETILSPAARDAFRHLDDVARLHFPDTSILHRAAYVTRMRESMIASRSLGRSERIIDAVALERLIRSDAETLKRANALLRKTSRTKILLYLGGAIAFTGGGLAYLSKEVTEHAKRNTGCFMYTRDLTNNVRKCRIAGCSCPMDLTSERAQTERTACAEIDLWDKMRVRGNECARARSTDDSDRVEPFCVHCDWEESDVTSVDFVDKDKIPENAFVACERMDAVDALHEVIGSTLDDAFGVGSQLTKVAKDSLTSSAGAVSWILYGVAALALLVAVVWVWRFFGTVDRAIGQIAPPPPPATTPSRMIS